MDVFLIYDIVQVYNFFLNDLDFNINAGYMNYRYRPKLNNIFQSRNTINVGLLQKLEKFCAQIYDVEKSNGRETKHLSFCIPYLLCVKKIFITCMMLQTIY